MSAVLRSGMIAPGAVSRRFAALTLVREGDGYILGSRHTSDFVAVPEVGGRVVQWLQDGCEVSDCARRAENLVGEPVDVAGFIDGLTAAGLLLADNTAPDTASDPPAAPSPGKIRLGRALFGPIGRTVQALLVIVAAVAMVVDPRTRPIYTDAIPSSVPLASILLVMVIGTVFGLAHECAHVLAAWAAGVSSRVSISRRMVVLVYQTDLTRLWSVPRRRRVVPLLAGLLFDGATAGVLIILELTVTGLPAGIEQLIRTLVITKVSGIIFQFLIFMRTDVYALFVVATGCKNLWDTKGAVARRAIRRATPADTALLATVGDREVRWAKVFLCLYVPGVVVTTVYFVFYVIPAWVKLMTMSLDEVHTDGLLSPGGAAGVMALALTATSSGFVLWGLVRTLIRLTRRLAS